MLWFRLLGANVEGILVDYSSVRWDTHAVIKVHGEDGDCPLRRGGEGGMGPVNKVFDGLFIGRSPPWPGWARGKIEIPAPTTLHLQAPACPPALSRPWEGSGCA